MRKILFVFFTLLSLLLVSCQNDKPPIPGGGKGNPNVLISDLEIKGNTLTATLDVLADVNNNDDLLLVLHDVANLIYYEYKDTINTKSFTFFFAVKVDDNNVGAISYKVNESLDNTGLSYISSDLTLN